MLHWNLVTLKEEAVVVNWKTVGLEASSSTEDCRMRSSHVNRDDLIDQHIVNTN
jgi:hypothetical protein